MSNMHLASLYSASAGLLLGYLASSRGTCAPGYAAVNLSVPWVCFSRSWYLHCCYRVDASRYRAHNSRFATQASATSAPRQSAPHEFTRCTILALTAGVCDALSVLVGASVGDSWVMLAAALALSRRTIVRVPIVLMLAYRATGTLPLAYDLVRGIVIVLGVLCRHARMRLRYDLLRLAVASVMVLCWGGTSCTNRWMILSPVSFLAIAFGLRLNPPVVLALASLRWNV